VFSWQFLNESSGYTEGQAFLNQLRDCHHIKTLLHGVGLFVSSFLEKNRGTHRLAEKNGLSSFILGMV
jgi:hypothetical protein